MAKEIGFGSEFYVTTTTAATAIGQIKSISGPDSQTNDVDTTTLDSSTNYRTFVPGLIDPGVVTLEVVSDPTALVITRMRQYFEAGTAKTFNIYHNTSGNAQQFSAYVQSIGQEIPLDDLIMNTYTLKLSGDAGWTS